jgi:hypothetical protein
MAEIHLYREGGVSPGVRAIFEDSKDALGIPWVPEIVRALGACPAYLELAWPQLRPNLDQAGFAMSAAFIADRALDFIREIYEPTYGPDKVHEAVRGEVDELRSTIRALHYGAPQVMLIGGALLEAMKFPSAGGKGRPGSRDELHAERLMRRAGVEVIDEDEATPNVRAVYADIRLTTTLPFVPVEFSAIARWPAYLELAWDDLKLLIPHPSYRLRRRSLSYYAAGGTHYFTEPVRLGHDALLDAGMSEGVIEGVKTMLQAFVAAGPAQLLNTVALEHALHPRPPEVTR